MRCPHCQKTILDNVKRCPYCGQDTSKPAKSANVVDMFENSPVSPLGAMPAAMSAGSVPSAEHHEAVHTEVKKRRWQRWAFYALVVIVVLSAIGLMVKMNNDNTKLLLAVTQSQDELAKKSSELKTKEQQAQQSDQALKQAQIDLNAKAEQYKKDTEAQGTAVADLQQCKLEVTAASANIYNLILTLGTGISNTDLSRIPVAEANIGTGVDTDKDGLSDEFESAIGTDKDKADTDGDTFNDKDEILRGFDPLKAGGRLAIDTNYAAKQKGRIVIAVDGNKAAWYVNPADAKRYFLGRPADGYKAMRSIDFWTKSYSQQ